MRSGLHYLITGISSGIANGLFGSGGGLISVPFLEKSGLDAKSAHGTSIGITLVLSIASAVIYLLKGSVDISLALKLIPGGLAGAAAGAILMKKISNSLLKKIFAIFLIISGLKLFLR